MYFFLVVLQHWRSIMRPLMFEFGCVARRSAAAAAVEHRISDVSHPAQFPIQAGRDIFFF